jgi:hypothetical protein
METADRDGQKLAQHLDAALIFVGTGDRLSWPLSDAPALV